MHEQNNMVCKSRKICSYANDITVFASYSNLGIVIRQLEDNSAVIEKWVSDYLLKLNNEKCLLMIFVNKCTGTKIKIGNSEIKESDYENLLGITFDNTRNNF